MLTPVKNKNFLLENSYKNFPEESFYEFFRWESFPGWLDQWFAVARTFAAAFTNWRDADFVSFRAEGQRQPLGWPPDKNFKALYAGQILPRNNCCARITQIASPSEGLTMAGSLCGC